MKTVNDDVVECIRVILCAFCIQSTECMYLSYVIENEPDESWKWKRKRKKTTKENK